MGSKSSSHYTYHTREKKTHMYWCISMLIGKEKKPHPQKTCDLFSDIKKRREKSTDGRIWKVRALIDLR